MSDEKKIDDGGPAFPHLGLFQGADGNLYPTPTQHCGLSLRDYFAGQALQGLMVGTELDALARKTPIQPNHGLATRFCYEVADAMIKQRKETP